MNLEGRITRLRAIEPGDIDLMYAWENDTTVWRVSGTLAPFSRHQLDRFIQEQQFDIFQTHQQRLMIETLGSTPIGVLDLFELDPINRRAGVGILICDTELRGRGYASDAMEIACRYTCDILGLHQLWCNVGEYNEISLALFRKAGFTEVGIKRDWQWHPNGYKNEILMQKIL